jgi:hypothetical protein
MTTPPATAAFGHFLDQLAQGRHLQPGGVADLLGVQEAALRYVARLAYPLSREDHAVQFILRDLLLLAKRRADEGDVPTALKEIGRAAAAPSPDWIASLAQDLEPPPPPAGAR